MRERTLPATPHPRAGAMLDAEEQEQEEEKEDLVLAREIEEAELAAGSTVVAEYQCPFWLSADTNRPPRGFASLEVAFYNAQLLALQEELRDGALLSFICDAVRAEKPEFFFNINQIACGSKHCGRSIAGAGIQQVGHGRWRRGPRPPCIRYEWA